MKKRFQNIKPRVLITHILMTLLYPLARTLMASSQRLLVFTDALTVIAALLLIAGVVYALFLHGDFDISSFVMRRGMKNAPKQTFEAFMANQKERREDSFNYPLFLGIVYIAAALIIAYVFY